MGVRIMDAVFDTALNQIKNNATSIHIVVGEPTAIAAGTFTGATELAERTGLTSGSFTGPVDGDVSGRKITVNAQAGISITASGIADHVVLTNGTDTIYAITTVTGTDISSGGTVDTAAFDIEITDATAS